MLLISNACPPSPSSREGRLQSSLAQLAEGMERSSLTVEEVKYLEAAANGLADKKNFGLDFSVCPLAW